MLHIGNDFCKQEGHFVGGGVCGYDDIVFVVYEIVGKIVGLVGDNRHAKDTQTAVAGYNHLRCGGHAGGIGTDGFKYLYSAGVSYVGPGYPGIRRI